jgi:hypothetical protein
VKTTKHRNVHAVQGDAIYPHLAVDEEKSMPEQERCQNTMDMVMEMTIGSTTMVDIMVKDN